MERNTGRCRTAVKGGRRRSVNGTRRRSLSSSEGPLKERRRKRNERKARGGKNNGSPFDDASCQVRGREKQRSLERSLGNGCQKGGVRRGKLGQPTETGGGTSAGRPD